MYGITITELSQILNMPRSIVNYVINLPEFTKFKLESRNRNYPARIKRDKLSEFTRAFWKIEGIK